MSTADESKEFDIFFSGEKSLKLESGEELKIPRLVWGAEARVVKTLGKLLKVLPELQNEKIEKITGQDILRILPKVIEETPDLVTEVVCSLTKKDKTWVEENLSVFDIVKIIYPFFPRMVRLFGTGPFKKLVLEEKEVEEKLPPPT